MSGTERENDEKRERKKGRVGVRDVTERGQRIQRNKWLGVGREASSAWLSRVGKFTVSHLTVVSQQTVCLHFL